MSLGHSLIGSRSSAVTAAWRSAFSETNREMAWNDSASLPRTLVRPSIAARRMMRSGDSLPSFSTAFTGGVGLLRFSENNVALGIEHADRVALEPRAEVAIRAVVDFDAVDRVFGAEVNLPPGIAPDLPEYASARRRRTCRSCCRRPRGSPGRRKQCSIALPSCAGRH